MIRKDPGFNSIFFEFVNDGEYSLPVLSLSSDGTTFRFTPSDLRKNEAKIKEQLQKMYINVNSTMLSNTTDKYNEVVDISADGTLQTKEWDNYQTYLLSSEGRAANEIPLTTDLRALASTTDTKIGRAHV